MRKLVVPVVLFAVLSSAQTRKLTIDDLLTGGEGSIAMTIAGVLLLGLVFNLLNFENGLGFISLSAYWQSVIRGVFLLLVIVLQARVLKQRGKKHTETGAGAGQTVG